MKVAILLFALAATAQAVRLLEEDVEWIKFKTIFEKSYGEESEELRRRRIFRENVHMIESHNRANGGYRMAVNEFADLTHGEFLEGRHGKISSAVGGKYHRPGAAFLFPENENPLNLPKHVDWRQKGFVTPVKNQGQCGSCWSFSTTGALEGQHFRSTGNLISLSEQNLVDCSTLEGDHGCNGGLMSDAFSYIAINGGIMSEEDYPYKGVKGNCGFNPTRVVATDTAWVRVPEMNETALQQASAVVGPISVAIDAMGNGFQFYKSGVYYSDTCSPTALDHGVLVVGYGNENGADYWLVKNSWGAQWGEQGYVKMARNRNNNCGIASMASYPIV